MTDSTETNAPAPTGPDLAANIATAQTWVASGAVKLEAAAAWLLAQMGGAIDTLETALNHIKADPPPPL